MSIVSLHQTRSFRMCGQAPCLTRASQQPPLHPGLYHADWHIEVNLRALALRPGSKAGVGGRGGGHDVPLVADDL